MSRNLRLGYAVKSAFFLFSCAVSAVPTRQSQRRKNKRQLGSSSSSLEESIEDAVNLNRNIEGEGVSESESDNDDDDGDDDDDTSSGHSQPPASLISTPSALPSASSAGSQRASVGRHIAIVGGTVAVLVFFALVGFLIYRWRASKKNNQQWSDKKYPPIDNRMSQYEQKAPLSISTDDKSSSAAHSNRQWSETITIIPKPSLLVLVPQGREKISEDHQTFFFDHDSNRSSNRTTVYKEMRSPSQNSSISQTAPYPYRNPTARKLYKPFQPPPIPETPELVSRFSWTNVSVRTSIDSSPRFRTVTSWVDNQAGRLSVKAKLAEMGGSSVLSTPSTPKEFGQHPGAPVGFLTQHQRLESVDLDEQTAHVR